MVRKTSRNKISFNQPKIFSSRRERAPKVRFKPMPIIKLVLLLIVLLAIIYFIFYSRFFQISDVIIEGNQLVSKEDIVKNVPQGQNIFLTKGETIRQAILDNIHEIRDVQIYKGIPDAVKVMVLEHNRALLWKSGDKYYLISSEGYVYRDVSLKVNDFTNLPRIEDNSKIPVVLGTKIVSPSFVAFVQNISTNLFPTINIEPDYFFISETTFDLNLKTKAGFTVKFDTLRSSKKQLDDLKRVLAEKRDQVNEYVDLRIDGWAYYK